MSELVGTAVELAVSQLLVFEDHRDSVGRLLDLRFKELMNTFVFQVLSFGVVPRDQ